MTELDKFVPARVLQHLSSAEKQYLKDIFARFGGYPELEQVWSLVDEPWVALGCDPFKMDDRISTFYQHPVWLLNGLITDKHSQSLDNRRGFTKWIVDQAPRRVVDFGGGFGGLARLIGAALPNVEMEVVEPHPHPAAIALAGADPVFMTPDSVTFTHERSYAYGSKTIHRSLQSRSGSPGH